MDKEQRIAYIQAQILCAYAEIEGMKAANERRRMQGYSDAYGEEEFDEIPNKYGLHHNAVIKYLMD